MQNFSNRSNISKYSILLTVSAALSLSACKKADDEASEYNEEESNISIDIGEDGVAIEASGNFIDDNGSSSSSSSSTSSSSSSKNGKFSVNADGFNLDIDIPQSFIEKSKNSDGLYPGSEVRNVNVNSQSHNDNGQSYERAEVRLEFTAPDNPNKVADWFIKKFKEEGGTAKRSGSTVSGQTDEGKDYTLTLSPNGSRTNGVLRITGIDE